MRYRLLCWKDLDYGVECRQLVIDLMAPLRWSRNGRGFYLNNSKKVADFTGAQETNTLEKTRRLHDVAPMVRPLRLSLGFPVFKIFSASKPAIRSFFLEGKKERLIHLFNQQLGQFWLDKAGIRPKIKWKQLVLRLISEYLRQCKLLSREKKNTGIIYFASLAGNPSQPLFGLVTQRCPRWMLFCCWINGIYSISSHHPHLQRHKLHP